MDSASIAMLAALVALVVCSGFFSATETAFSSLNRIRLKSRADVGDLRAKKTLALSEQYDKLLSTILIGNNVVNIAAASLGTVFFTRFFAGYGPTVSTVVLTVVVLIFGEISPKTLAKESPEQFATVVTPLIGALCKALTPITALFAQWKKLLTKLFRTKGGDGITEEELITMVSEAESEGGLNEHESELIRAAIEFNDLEVDEVLTPRVDIVAVEDTATADEVAAAFAQSGYSRLPVYHEDIDDIIGVIHEKDFYNARYHGMVELPTITAPVLYTTGNTKISELLRILQKEKSHMVVVVDEYGGTEGLATLEDILEELVGEIWDEHDEVIEQFQKLEDGSYLISCNADLPDLFDLFGLKGECSSATVSGWVMECIGRVPEQGDTFQSEGLDVTVTKVDHRRVLEIQVVVLPKENGISEEEAAAPEKDS